MLLEWLVPFVLAGGGIAALAYVPRLAVRLACDLIGLGRVYLAGYPLDPLIVAVLTDEVYDRLPLALHLLPRDWFRRLAGDLLGLLEQARRVP